MLDVNNIFAVLFESLLALQPLINLNFFHTVVIGELDDAPYVAFVSYSFAQMVFLGGHPAKYWPSSVVCAVWKCVRACTALVFIIAVHIGSKVLFHQP